MKKKLIHTVPVLLTAISLIGLFTDCGDARKKAREASEQRHEARMQELADSAAVIKARIDSTANRLSALRDETSVLLEDFTLVKPPRNVEGFYILRSQAGGYPLSGTGITARLTMSESLELIAALSGSTFNAIRAVSGGESVTSATVPHDQGLNYRAAGLNTVAFSGVQADSIASFITAHSAQGVTIQYIENGKVTGSLPLTATAVNTVSATYTLARAHSETLRLERCLTLDNRKLEIIHNRLE